MVRWMSAAAMVVWACGMAAWAAEDGLRVDCNFPGGNVVVQKIDGDKLLVQRDIRDTQGDWFYWYFRVRGAAGRTLNVKFAGGRQLAALGPAVSVDGGRIWTWAGKEAVKGNSFVYRVPADAAEVRFSFGMPYTQANLDEFLVRYKGSAHLRREVLCRTKGGREAEMLYAGRLDGQAKHRVVLTCRHHACEMMASYSLEGILQTILGDSDDGRWLRENVEFLIVPFVDKDGVEAGDQGKNRRPRDHNRDYAGEAIYPTVAAIKQLVPKWSQGRVRLAMDMHCPYIGGGRNEEVFFVEGADEASNRQLRRFGELLEKCQRGPLAYSRKNNIGYGKEWNTASTMGTAAFSRWAVTLDDGPLATTIEIPYALAGGKPVTADSARELGVDLARVMVGWLKE